MCGLSVTSSTSSDSSSRYRYRCSTWLRQVSECVYRPAQHVQKQSIASGPGSVQFRVHPTSSCSRRGESEGNHVRSPLSLPLPPGICGIKASITYIISYCAREKKSVLLDKSNLPSETCKRYIACSESINQHLPTCDIIETRNQVDHRGFTGARFSNERDRLPLLGNQVDIT